MLLGPHVQFFTLKCKTLRITGMILGPGETLLSITLNSGEPGIMRAWIRNGNINTELREYDMFSKRLRLEPMKGTRSAKPTAEGLRDPGLFLIRPPVCSTARRRATPGWPQVLRSPQVRSSTSKTSGFLTSAS